MFPLCFGVIALLGRPVSSDARPDVTLWVLQPPGEIVAFEPSDFSRVGGVRIPGVAFHEPNRISINGAGQILARIDDEHLWLWDGSTATTLPTAPPLLGRAESESRAGTPFLRQWLLGNDGGSLFVLHGESRQERDPSTQSATSRLVMWETNLWQQPRRKLFDREDKPCLDHAELDATAVPCADADVWAPGGVVSNCFVVTHWRQEYPGDAHTAPVAVLDRALHRRRGDGWQTTKIDSWGELLDLGGTRLSWVQAIEDGGCCGWTNEGSDVTWVTSEDTSLVLFDEWSRFTNQNYDVSFSSVNARIAPTGERVAYTIHATSGATEEIRLSSDGHADSLEVAAIHRSLKDLPIVEVHDTRPPRLLLSVRHAELVGWMSDSEVLVVDKRRLVAIDVITKRRRESGILVRWPEDAIVVWHRP